MMNTDYVLVTTARNEEKLIEQTVQSVALQTVLPKMWVIVSDGSTDRTDDIVRRLAKQHKFIVFVRRDAHGERSFSSKADAFRVGNERLGPIVYSYIGNLDADISLGADYYKRICEQFQANRCLGIAGGVIHELSAGKFVPQRISLSSVAGAVQMFRRECYAQIGGYIPLRFGGIDSAAEIMARMHSWEVQSFADLEVRHHRLVASGEGRLVRTKWRHGLRHYSLGYHPLFEVLRNAYRLTDRPYVVGAVLMTLGYLSALVTGKRRELPAEAVRHLQSEQMQRLRGIFVGWANGRIAATDGTGVFAGRIGHKRD